MSNLLFATPKELTGWLSKLASGKRVMAPRQEGPSVVFRAYTAKELAAADVNALLKRSYSSPKQAILPQCETLVAFKSAKDPEDMSKLTTTVENPCVAEPTVLFGGRPCDARGFVVLDRPYLEGKFKDPYYAARREATAIVTQACPTAMNGCFCNWVGSNPADKEGSDVIFTAVEGGFVFEAVTEKGEALLAGAGFADAATALDTAFGDITATNHPWADGVNVPVIVSSADDMYAALDAGEKDLVVVGATIDENNFNGR